MKHARYYRTKLKSADRAVYDALVFAMENLETETSLPVFDYSHLDRIIYALNFDNPHLFYVDFYRTRIWKDMFSVRAELCYKYTTKEIQNLQHRIDEETKLIVHAARGKKGKELALYLHDRLVRRGVYKEDPTHPDDAHTIVGMLLHNECVCEGYAKLFQYLADLTGLLGLIVTGNAVHPDGTSGGHAWNIVRYDGICCHVDVTFDQLIGRRFCSQAYFGLSTKEISYDHQLSPMFHLPDCPQYGGNLELVSGTRELMDFLAREVSRGASYSEVRLSKGFAQGELMDRIQKKLSIKDFRWYNKIQSFWYGEQTISLFITWK